MIGFGILDVIKHEGIVGCEGRGEQATKGEEKILGGKRLSVGPSGILAKLENPFVGLFRVHGIPFGRYAGQSDSVFGGMGLHQSLEKRTDDIALQNSAHDMRIQSFGFTTVPHDENPFLGSHFHAAARLA